VFVLVRAAWLIARKRQPSEKKMHPADEADTVFVVDDDAQLRSALTLLLETEGFRVRAYPSARAFLDACDPNSRGCLILDVGMPEMDGLTLQQTLLARGVHLPIIFLTGQGDIAKAVQAVRAGAADFMEKPVSEESLLGRIRAVLADEARRCAPDRATRDLLARYERLTQRQREVMALVTTGLSNKEIARRLGISTRTAEGHRLRVMERMQAASLWELTEMARVCTLSDRARVNQT
jgi:two-component system response regulator FixJ